MISLVRKALPYLLFAPALLPLVYISGFLYPYVAPKTFLFRGLGIVVLASLLFLALSHVPLFWERLKQKVTWIPAALLFVAYVTSLVGIDFYHSFWSIYDRGDGLLTLTAAVIFFYGIILSADRHFLPRLFKVSAWVASIVALYAILQWLQGVSGMNIPLVEIPRGRIGATFGNAAFLAAYLGMTLFATLAVAHEYYGRWRRIIYIGAALQLVAIILTATRGTFLALLIVGLATALYLAWKPSLPAGREKGQIRKYARLGILSVLIIGALFFAFRAPLSNIPFEPIRRIASISLTDPTVESRLFIWQNVLKEGFKKPFTGYGAEHADVLFSRVYDPSAILEQWFDRTHNAFLDYFIQHGVLGVLLYAGLIGALGFVGLRLFRKQDKYGAFLLLLAGVYAVQNFFVFDTALTLWFLLAILAAALAYASAANATPLRLRIPQPIALAIAGAMFILVYPISVQPMRANFLLAEGYRDHVVNVNNAISLFNRGLVLGTYADLEYGYQAYSMYTDHQQTMLSGEERVAAYRYALETLTRNFERYPYDARTAVYLAHVLDSAPDGEAVDETFLRMVLTRAIELSPKRAQANYILANIPLKKGDQATQAFERNQYYREAIGMLEEYAARVPNFAEPRFIIASLYVAVGDRESGKQWADEGLALYKGNTDVARKAMRYYLAVEDWQNVRRFLADIVTADPNDYQAMYDLAKAEFLVGNRERALEIFKIVREKAPNLVGTDPVFLEAINRYIAEKE